MVMQPHRQSPNRARELRERAWALVQRRLTGLICARCGCTLANYDERCEADLDDRCPGFNAIELESARARRELGIE